MRKENTLVSPTTPQASMLSTSQDSTATTTLASAHTTPSRHHGSKSKLTPDAKHTLLLEAQQWEEYETVNWSAIARRHGLTDSNGGQTVKEFL